MVGQVVQGQVLDEATNAPVAAATVELLSSGGDRLRTVSTDEDGRFTIPAPRSGSYRLRAGRVGFHTVTTPLFDLVR
ncbi:MAG: carboxypeptidase-like regulatory domain-containing protein, partial [Thioalkalivibrio sp.]|nr:carboxypeptidase-like regulatory domain-containing protein [Thioalkalivibrio sp.]